MPPLLDHLTPTTLLLTLVTLLLTYLFTTSLYNIYLHPLSAIPGPFLAKFTEYYSFYVFAHNNRSAFQHTLIQKYGSPVRTGPNELVFADPKSHIDIYGQSSNPCLKDQYSYSAPTVTGARNVLNACHRVQHQQLRRMLAAEMSERGILGREEIVAEKVGFFVEEVFMKGKRESEGGSFEVYKGLNRLYIDIVTEFTFGRSFDTMKGRNAQTPDDITAFFDVVPAATALPWTRYLPVKKLRDAWKDVGRLEKNTREMVREFVRGLEGRKEWDEGGKDRTFLTQLATVPDPNTGKVATEDELVENAIVFMVAGSGTTATTVAYVLYECGRREATRKRLIKEIRRAFPDKSKMPAYEAASKLPFLNCVVQETLRCRGPLTTSGMTRISPGRVLGSVYVPKGVQLYTDFYALARDAETFADPESWIPERWEHPTEAMLNMYRPWSLGPRNCIGRHLAEVCMLVAIARIYQLCDVVVDETKTTPDMMRLKDQGKITPWDESLTLKMVAKA